MSEAFWRIQDGPNQWAATLRWLCFSETTLLLATKEANRVLRQLSLGGQTAMQAGLHYAFEVVTIANNNDIKNDYFFPIPGHGDGMIYPDG